MIGEAARAIERLLRGAVPEPIDTDGLADGEQRELAVLLNRLFAAVGEIHEFIVPLSQGRLEEVRVPPTRNFLASPFKQLHSRLEHLTWQAKQVAKGDYSQRVDFMGDFSQAFNAMIVALDRHERAMNAKIEQLQEALSRIAELEGILPICTHCRKVRVEGADPAAQDSWVDIEGYIEQKTRTHFSHGICPKCMQAHYAHLLD